MFGSHTKLGGAAQTLPLPPTSRRTDISWLRILAVLLLFPYHTARVFDMREEFYVHNDQASNALSFFLAYMQPWHMPLLFLLAGAASWFALARRGGREYAGERFKRLFLPFVIGLLILIPPQSYLGLLSHGGSAPGFFQWLPDFFHLNGDDMDGYFIGGHTWGHLWFIVHLFFYSLLVLPVLLFLRRGMGTRVVDLLARAASIRGVILLFALALVPALSVPDIAGGNPAFYIAIFLLGYLMVSDARFEAAIDRHKLVALVLGPVVCLLTTWFEINGWPAVPAWAEGPLELYVEVFIPWFFMVALLGYGRRFFGASGRLAGATAARCGTGTGVAGATAARCGGATGTAGAAAARGGLFSGSLATRFVRYADEASYPAYLLHQTVIVAVAFLIVRLDLSAGAKFAAILVASLAVTMLVYELVVRRVGATRFIFGMKPLRRGAASRAAATDAAAALDDGVDGPHQHDVADVARVDPGRELLRGRQDRRDALLVVLKVEQVSGLVAMHAEARAATPGAGERLRNDEVDCCPVARQPDAGLLGQLEVGSEQLIAQQRRAGKEVRVEPEIGVGRRRGDGQVVVRRMDVDSLCSDQNETLTLLTESLQGVQKCAARGYVESVWRHASSLSLIQAIKASASAGPRPGLVSRSAATWVSAAQRRPSRVSVRCMRTGEKGSTSKTLAPLSVGVTLRSEATASGHSE
jgi:peptidoglycan/LPS O-acetylase OafA/YrhL